MQSKTVVFFLILIVGVHFVLFNHVPAAQVTAPDSTADSVSLSLQLKVAAIFKAECATAGCHRGSRPKKDLSLETDKFLSSTINVTSQEKKDLKRVDTANPEKSYLLMKIKGEKGIKGSRMPDEAPPLKKEQIKIIQDWIYSLKKSPAKETEEKTTPIPDSKKKVQGLTDDPEYPPFWANRLINLPTTKTIGKNEVLFKVSHRFYAPTKKGYSYYYGPDVGAFVLLSLGYGITDNLDVALGHSNLYRESEITIQWRVLSQETGWRPPVSLAFSVGGSLITQEPEGKKVLRSENFKLNLQMCLSRQVINSLSFLLVPAYSSNTNRYPYHSEPAEGTWALGTGGKFTVIDDFSVIGEWVPVLSGYKAAINGWGAGMEYKIGGHVFQVFITNCYGLTSDQFLPGGDLKLSQSEFRLGFNIFRTF